MLMSRRPAFHPPSGNLSHIQFKFLMPVSSPFITRSGRVSAHCARDRSARFYDPVQVERIYYLEVELLLKQATGAEKIVGFDYQIRNRQLFSRGETKAGDYVLVVHNDFTATSGPRRVRDHLPPAEANERLQHRFAEINVWRVIRGPVESTPLAVRDARSIDLVDFVPTDFVNREKVGEVYRLAYNPKHRWFYFPGLEYNEVILLKCYDSSKDGGARFSAHSAFDDATSPSDAPTRESIECGRWSSGRPIVENVSPHHPDKGLHHGTR